LLTRCSDPSESNSYATIEITEGLILCLLRRMDKLQELQKDDSELTSLRYSGWLAEFYTYSAIDHLDEQPYRSEAEVLLTELEWGDVVLLNALDVFCLEQLRLGDDYGSYGARTECDAIAVYDDRIYSQAYIKHTGYQMETEGLERQKLLELLKQIEMFDTD